MFLFLDKQNPKPKKQIAKIFSPLGSTRAWSSNSFAAKFPHYDSVKLYKCLALNPIFNIQIWIFSRATLLENWRWQGEVVTSEQINKWNISLAARKRSISMKKEIIYRGLVLWTKLVVQELRNNCCFADPEIFNIYSALNVLQYVDLSSIFWMLNNISFVLLFFY